MTERLYLACLFGFFLGFVGAALFSFSKYEVSIKKENHPKSRLLGFLLSPFFSVAGFSLFIIKLLLLLLFFATPDLFFSYMPFRSRQEINFYGISMILGLVSGYVARVFFWRFFD